MNDQYVRRCVGLFLALYWLLPVAFADSTSISPPGNSLSPAHFVYIFPVQGAINGLGSGGASTRFLNINGTLPAGNYTATMHISMTGNGDWINILNAWIVDQTGAVVTSTGFSMNSTTPISIYCGTGAQACVFDGSAAYTTRYPATFTFYVSVSQANNGGENRVVSGSVTFTPMTNNTGSAL